MTTFTGTGALLRFALRRDRLVLPAWIAILLAYTVGGAAAAIALYPDLATRLEAAAAVNDMPALVMLYGRIWDPTSLGAVAMMKPLGFGGVFAALFGILLVTRHSRAEEESGRLELLATQPIGRLAPTASALLLTAAVMAILAIGNGFGVAAAGLPASSAWAFACSTSLTGLHFAAVAVFYGQVTRSSRTANVLALSELALAFLLRGSADVAGDATSAAWWSWLSPLGWQEQVRPFAGDHYAPMLLFVASAFIIVVWEFRLARARDFDAGLLPQRDGRDSAKPALRTSFALAVRLQRGLLVGMVVSFAIMSWLLGSIVSDVQRMFDSPQMAELVRRMGGSANMVDAFTSFELGFVAIISALCGVVLAKRFGTEEQAGRIEPLLASAVSRARVMSAFLVVALLGTTALQLVLGLGFGVANGMQLGSFEGLPRTIGAACVYLPAIWLIVCIALALAALSPALTNVSWLVVSGVLIIGEFGAMFAWPQWLMNLSPFTHVPRMPSVPMAWMPTLLLLGLALSVGASALAWYRKRDLATA